MVDIKELFKKREEKKTFTYILMGSKIFVFAVFLYVSIVMFNLEREIEGIILLFAIALWLILNKLDKGG